MGQWTYPASALYVQVMQLLHGTTGEDRYLDWARNLVDMEMEFLSQPLPSNRPE